MIGHWLWFLFDGNRCGLWLRDVVVVPAEGVGDVEAVRWFTRSIIFQHYNETINVGGIWSKIYPIQSIIHL
jgi:hypothetical protein